MADKPIAAEAWTDYAADNPYGPPVTEPHELYVEDYEPHFDRLSTERRVLGHITDDEHVRGPRNTIDQLDVELTEDPHTRYDGDKGKLADMLEMLVDAGLVE